MHVALLFGSFNPPHNAHVALGDYVIREQIADQVWYVVSPQNPFKSTDTLAPFNNRVEMTHLAIEGHAQLTVQTIENELPRPSYTFHTIQALYIQFPKHEFSILCGSDIIDQLPTWHRSEELQKIVKFIVYPRGDMDAQCSKEMQNAPRMEISSTRIRSQMMHNYELLPSSVADYIKQHNLYSQ